MKITLVAIALLILCAGCAITFGGTHYTRPSSCVCTTEERYGEFKKTTCAPEGCDK